MKKEELQAAVEAILFAAGDSVALERIADALEQDVRTTERLIDDMMLRYRREDRGIQIVRLENAYQLCTKKELYGYLIRLEKQPRKLSLSDAAMETLSIIAYRQPVTKAEIEKIRGVRSDHAVNKLVEYHLVKELGRMDAPGRPILFGTTEEFLRSFGVNSLEELPALSAVQTEDFRAEAEKEVQLKLDL